MTYHDLVNDYRVNPREIPTAPINGSEPKWFSVYVRQNELFVASGKTHADVCHLNPDRRLNRKEFDTMLDLFSRRERGEPVAQEAKAYTINQSYWYGIFKEASR